MKKEMRPVILSVLSLGVAVAASWGKEDAPRLVPKAGAALTYRLTAHTESPDPSGARVTGGTYVIMIRSNTESSASGTRRPITILVPVPPVASLPTGSDYASWDIPDEFAARAQARSQVTLSYFVPTVYVVANPKIDVTKSTTQQKLVLQDDFDVLAIFLSCQPSDLQKFMPLGKTKTLDLTCQQHVKFPKTNGLERERDYPVEVHLSYGGKDRTTTEAGTFDTQVIDMKEVSTDQESESTFHFSETIGATVKLTRTITNRAQRTITAVTELLKYTE